MTREHPQAALQLTSRRTVRLIVFSDDWGRHPSSCQHLVRELLKRNRQCCHGGCVGCRDYRVLWVNTIGTRRPSLNRADLGRVVGKAKGWLQKPVPAPSLWSEPEQISPKMWPGFRRPWQRRVNAASIAWGVTEALGRRSDEERIVLTTLPITADLVGKLDVDRWVYYCVDDFSAWPGLDSGVMQTMERELVGKVDDVVVVSQTLRQRMAGMGREAGLLTHGIDLEHWKVSGGGGAKPQALLGANRPIVLFWGLIDRRLDVAWCRALADALRARGGTLVLAGPRQSADPAIERLPSTLLPGAVAYDDLPTWAAQADVLVMPYVDAPVTRAMQPLKLKEYLATGKPVVVRDLPATRLWKHAADVVADADAFVDAVLMRARTGLTLGQAQARGPLVNESWQAKAQQLASIWAPQAPTPLRRAA